MATALNLYSGTAAATGYTRVGHNSGGTNPDGVWSFAIGDASMASINSVRIYYSWNNTAAGTGWGGTYNYICKLYNTNNASLIASVTLNLGGASGSGYVDIGGLSLTPGATYYVHWNQNGSTLSTMKAFGNTAQSIDILTYTVANHAPYWSGGSVSVTPNNIIAENITSVSVSWSGAYDQDGDQLTYYVYRVTSSHGYKCVYNGTNSSFTDSTFTTDADVYVEPGQVFRYDVYVYDSHGAWASGCINSANITRNNLTPASLNYGNGIYFDTTSFPMNRGTPSNINGNTSFTYNISCNYGLTVYNATSDVDITDQMLIWRTGDPTPNSNQPYIKFSELVAALESVSYCGTLVFTLSTTNIYGTTKSSSANVFTDLRVDPLWTTPAFAYSGGYTINSHLYYLPDVRAITLSWAAATEQIAGGAITYDVEYKISTSSDWIKIGSNISSTSIDMNPPSGDSQLTYNVRVTAKTAYSKSNQKTVTDILVDKYLRPIFGLSSKKRKTTSVVISLNITPRTTILSTDYSISTLNFLKCDNFTYVNLPTTDWSPTFEYGISPYTDSNFDAETSYTMICRFNDSIGAILGGSYATAMTLSIPITAFIPMFSIRKLGIAINDINDGIGSFIFRIKGKINSVSDASGNVGYYVNGVNILLLAHPVGELYWSADPTSPATLFGGTWVAITDKFVVAAGSTYAAGSNYGAAQHTHTTSILGGNYAFNQAGCHFIGASSTDGVSSTAFQSSSASNIPPCVAAYCWKRTA